MSAGIGEDDVFKDRAVVDPCVGIGGEVKSEIGEIVFLFAADGRTGFEIKPVAFVKDFCVLENRDVAVQGSRLIIIPSFLRDQCRCKNLLFS